ncbi:hypothetical protein U1872_07975 [Sphingomonas sp. RB3P16]|uniref:hypothetical protein n=1 Tax=Parasphingomonas frigoris TaxID=3096163 RepID=UPI002FC61DAB
MTQINISRRAALGGLAVTAFATSVPAFAATSAPSVFQRLLARYRQLCADELAYDTDLLEPMAEEYARRAAQVPHVSATYDNVLGGEARLSTSCGTDVAIAIKHIRGMKTGGWDRNDQFNQACRRIRAGDLHRRRELRRIRTAIGAQVIEARSEQLNDLAWRAGLAAIECPVQAGTDLAAKIELITETDRWECDAAIAAILADARRLGGVA